MVAKLVIVLLVLAIVMIAAVVAAFRFFSKKEEHKHEKDMFREKRDAELLNGDSIDRELEREREQ